MARQPANPRVDQDLTSRPLSRSLLRLALPLAFGQVLHALYAMVDAFWLGRENTVSLAAVGASTPVHFITVAFGMGFANAGTALVAQFTGARLYRRAEQAAAQTILVLCGIVLSASVLMQVLLPQVLGWLQVPEDVRPAAAAYLRIILAAMPISAFTMAYGGVLRAVGDTLTVIVIIGIGNLVNAVLDPVLIFGWLGLPRMGVQGAAAATALCQVGSAIACFVCLRRGRAGLAIRRTDWKPDWPLIGKTLRVGLPAAASGSSTSIGFAVQQSMVNTFGKVVMGAYTTGFRIIHVLDAPTQAMVGATAPVVGQALGAGKPELARKAAWTSTLWVAAIMFLPLAFLTWKGHWVATKLVPPDVADELGRFFLFMPLSTYFFGVLSVLTAAFIGSGHTTPIMFLHIARLWALRIPLVWLFALKLAMGSVGIYVGLAAANITSAALGLAMFLLIKWETAVVPVTQPDAEAEEAGEIVEFEAASQGGGEGAAAAATDRQAAT
ncbi:MAG: MATE family efflux transporter [Candidatus Brocadiaceae bacterium]|nr:MATE family efflux transporter [Candidatus Brocadiaceae bacterium]